MGFGSDNQRKGFFARLQENMHNRRMQNYERATQEEKAKLNMLHKQLEIKHVELAKKEDLDKLRSKEAAMKAELEKGTFKEKAKIASAKFGKVLYAGAQKAGEYERKALKKYLR